MKKGFVVLAATAVMLAGCGKSADQVKLEADLSAKVQQLHDEAMTKMQKLPALMSQIDGAVAKHDSLAKAFPKLFAGKSTDDLKAAKEKLMAVKADMNTWMKGFKPYKDTMTHADAMSSLQSQVNDLTKMTADIGAATQEAGAALGSHSALANEVTAQFGKAVKKR